MQPITAGNTAIRGANEWFVTMFWNHYSGPDALYQALTGQIKWTDPVFVEPLQILQQWFAKGWVGKSSQDYFTTHFPTCYTNLFNVKALPYWTGTWVPSTTLFRSGSGRQVQQSLGCGHRLR